MKWIRGIFSLIWKCYVGVIFALTAVLYYPFITPLLFSEKTKKRAFRVFVVWSWTVRILCLYFVQKRGTRERPKAPFIIIANHTSYLDIFLMYSMFPNEPFIFLGKTEILKYPLIKTYFKRFNIPVDRSNSVKSARALVKASRLLKEGWSLVIFPEGGIPDDDCPKMVPFKEGSFQLAKNMKTPILPITFLNNYRLFSDPTNILGPAHPGVSQVVIHPYVSVGTIEKMSQTELSDHCFEIINAPILEKFPHFKE
jgi:1-acyl-sn-glycerol-3-phosphate acyltransferase